MAVNRNTIINAILAMQDEMKTITDSNEAKQRNAELLADIIKDAILSAEVSESAFTVSGTSPSGAVSGTATQNKKGTLN